MMCGFVSKKRILFTRQVEIQKKQIQRSVSASRPLCGVFRWFVHAYLSLVLLGVIVPVVLASEASFAGDIARLWFFLQVCSTSPQAFQISFFSS